MALAVESVAVHALIYQRWPALDGMLIAANILTVWWMVRHYRAVGATPIVVQSDVLWIRHGTMVSARLPWQSITQVRVAAWRDQPPEAAARFLKLSGGDDPTVLISCDPPADVVVMLGFRRPVSLFGLRLDDPRAFVEACAARIPTAVGT